MLDLEYIEIDGIRYPNIETGIENLESDLSKCGICMSIGVQYIVNC